MCRLFLCNQDFANQQQELLLPLFDELQRRQGGQGQGVAVCYRGDKPISLAKGVKMRNEKLMKLVKYGISYGGSYYIYHTRVAVSGSVSDANAMPFVRGDTCLAHNGLAESITQDNINGHSDTDALSLMLSYGVPPKNLYSYGMTGTYVGFWYGLPFVVKNTDYSDLELAVSTNKKCWAFASTLQPIEKQLIDNGYNIYSVPEMFWIGGNIQTVIDKCFSKEWSNTYTSNYGGYKRIENTKKKHKNKNTAYLDHDEVDLSTVEDVQTFKETNGTIWVQYTDNNVTYARRPTLTQLSWLEDMGMI